MPNSPALTPNERALRARIAAHSSWAKTTDRTARTAPARRAADERFEKLVDPEGRLPEDLRIQMAQSAKKAHFAALALKSAKARRARSSRRPLGGEAAWSWQVPSVLDDRIDDDEDQRGADRHGGKPGELEGVLMADPKWWVISDEAFAAALCRVADGDDPWIVAAEFYANSDVVDAPMSGTDGIHATDLGQRVSMLAATVLANSRRWFPSPHERGAEHALLHMALGLAGETGEVIEVVKKAHRTGDMPAPARLADEMADVLTYLLNICALLDIDIIAALAAKQAECERRWGAPS